MVLTYRMDNKAKKYFDSKGVTKGKTKGTMTVQCRVWKQVGCRQAGDCEQKSSIECHQVCKTMGWNGEVKDCKPEICNSEYGTKLCVQTAILG